jgi:hypothetical protein
MGSRVIGVDIFGFQVLGNEMPLSFGRMPKPAAAGQIENQACPWRHGLPALAFEDGAIAQANHSRAPVKSIEPAASGILDAIEHRVELQIIPGRRSYFDPLTQSTASFSGATGIA